MSVYKKETADRLNRCMRSIWDDQTVKPNQIILVEDGPLPEELHMVIKEWKQRLHELFDVVVNEENLGLTKSLNKGLNIVQSELIARMDTDDQSTPLRFELQEKYMREHPEIDVLGGACNIVDENGVVISTKHFKETHEEMLKQICWRSPLPHPAVMMRASMFKDKGLKYDEQFRNSQDIALWVDALQAGCKFANLDDIVLNFTEDKDVYKRRGKVRALNEYKSFSRVTEFLYGKYSLRRILPVIRFCLRRLPPRTIGFLYHSNLVKSIYKK